MCGIAGLLSFKQNLSANKMAELSKRLQRPMYHRGPDSSGAWYDVHSGILLAHNRLSILDTTDAANQPMHSLCGRYVLSFNGEIYNFREISDSLKLTEPRLNCHSDTAVLLTAISLWGLDDTLKKISGMYAFALWDKQDRTLTLVRDPIGKKPLYYGIVDSTLMFASELKALKVLPYFHGKQDPSALSFFLRYCYIPAPMTIYQGIKKLLPGTQIIFNCQNYNTATPEPYWLYQDLHHHYNPEQQITSETEAQEQLTDLLKNSVKQRMRSDVDYGAFLSGGIDSSLVAALMADATEKKIKTFTVGFHQDNFNEAEYAKAISEYLGTEHHEYYFTAKDACSIIPNLAAIYDEPFADSSQIPTYLLSKHTKSHVTVALSGDGGDEFFAGYNRYVWLESIWQRSKKMPQFARNLSAVLQNPQIISSLERMYRICHSILPKNYAVQNFPDKLRKLIALLPATSDIDMYFRALTVLSDNRVFSDNIKQLELFDLARGASILQQPDIMSRMISFDINYYLPDDILVKVDRASMANSLEVRSPLLDKKVIEYAHCLPRSLKIRNKEGKWILRKILNQYIPEKYYQRPKMGFGIPLGEWLRGDLQCWADDLIRQCQLSHKLPGLKQRAIDNMWQEHKSGRRDWQYALWNVLMYQSWQNHEKNTQNSLRADDHNKVLLSA